MDKQIQLFFDLSTKDKIKAQVVGRNLFLKKPSCLERFEAYFDFCLNATCSLLKEECRFFVEEAEYALQVFCDSCDLNDNMLDKIYEWRDRLYQTEQALIERTNAEIFNENEERIIGIKNLYRSLNPAKNNKNTLDKIKVLDENIAKDFLTEGQMKTYASLSENITNFIVKVKNKEAKEKNLEALQNLKILLEEFEKEKSYKKDEKKLASLLKNRMFCIDLSNVEPEVVAYYNHIYSTIFSKVKDGLKLKMAEWAVEAKY